ncbi:MULTISPECIES: transcriptional regulator GcvA [Pasteurellaceae]|uniref:Transcriptional regulator GcvA n=1 Tax=Pasteurella atlantica TaxID=2827233 RepID=A0AAW8CNK3_9PAST|nr:transcriptional regulator GcvA [Pasteurella atlantica]MBR0573273.1 transcriptional regulator GcvA [Pasteurella atlantica]MDP8039111.1 transcriptional regulator GcvA [Pasteurella atlantica]MDP8041290.1 transcriptional regulator GcvA [Pasteurella atlantica]MDP8043427.1 transcriptional regulator GcvA [Pasteurella atlantica]MDP8045513.1 transcriptional regulator GcvA [Pasteurella atlantica]
MNRKLPPLNALKTFVSAAKHLNFTKAAEELFVTQAAVSHQIKLLEEFLGTPLFYRHNRMLELTEVGLQYFEDIQPLLDRVIVATDRAKKTRTRQVLTISVPQTFGIHWLVPRLNDFHQKHPDIEVRIKGVDQDEGKLGKEIDVAIYYGLGHWENLESVRLAEARIIILATDLFIKEHNIQTPEDLIGKPLLHSNTHNKWKKMKEHLNLDGLDAESGSVFSHSFMVLQAAMHQQGIAITNRILAHHEIDEGHLVELFPTDLYDDKAFYVVYPPQMAKVEKIHYFVEWIKKEMEEENIE